LRQRRVEGERIEYKAGWNPDPILRTLCAFANDLENLGGGYVVIGQDCDDSGLPIFPPKGLPDDQLDRIQRELLGYCNLIQPPYFPMLSVERFEGRNLIILWVPGGQHRPYKVPRSVLARKKEYRHYIRRYSSTVEARGDDERDLISLTARVPFDDCFNQTAGADDLSPRLMEEFLREVGSDLADEFRGLSGEALGRQMNVVGGPAESAFPKNVGLLFFNELSGRFFPATQIDVVWFPEGPGGDRFDEKTFAGPLARIVRDALGHIQANYLKQTVVKHADRAEAERFWNFPYAAIEEALVNAVYHRSYEIREPIEVRITPDDLVVLSFPGPDRSIRMADLRAGRAVSRRYRNRRIGEFLKELDLAEGRSTGISKILKVMRVNGSPAPEFDTDSDRSYFLIRLPAHAEILSEETPVKAPVKALGKTSEKVSEKTSEKMLAEIHKNNFVTIDELSQLVGVTTRSVERNLKILHDSGLLERVGPARGGHWAVKEIGLPSAWSELASEITSVEASGKTSGEIVGLMRVNPRVTIPEIADTLGLTTRAIEMQVARLKAGGRVERVGPTKGGHWVVKEDA
jgi:ATP-dependent DNA helicase RecG